MNIDVLKEIFLKGIDNFDFFGSIKKKTRFEVFMRTIRLIIWYPFINIPIKRIHNKTIKFVYATLHQIVLKEDSGECILVGFGKKGYDSTVKYFSNYVSYFDLLLFCISVPSDIRRKAQAYDWVFFRLLDRVIVNINPQKVIIAGIYDGITTWIAYLCHQYNITLCISQHGICGPYNIPHKIPVNEVKVFCRAECEIFDSITLNPNKVKYIIKGYKTSIVFEKGTFSKEVIAVASQPGYENVVMQIVESILKSTDKYEIMIYAHPSDSFQKRECVIINGNIVQIIKKKRYSNISVLCIINSSIAYDYLACSDFDGKIICYHMDNRNLSIYKNESIMVVDSRYFCELIQHILI